MSLDLTRRQFLAQASALGAAAALAPVSRAFAADSPRKRMAILTNIWHLRSHAQHMGDRFLVGYPQEGRWKEPALEVVSAYVDQSPVGDLSRQRAEEFGFRLYPSIAESLRCGGDKLDVDAVLIIGEHGDYPRNEFEQVLYPRYEFFKQTVDVFRQDGRVVPVFNDKHLSWKWEWAKEMVELAHELEIPFMAGSSLPVTWRMPSVEFPWGADAEEVMCVAMGGIDSYDFHALEVIQCMAERRRGGESGVAWIEGLRGDAVWKAFDAGSWEQGGWSPRLFHACLSRSLELVPPRPGYSHRYPTREEMARMVTDPVCYRFEYNDGLRATMFLLNGLVGDFTFAAQLKGEAEPLSTLFHLPPNPNVTYSAEFMSKVERMFLTGKAVYPAERTLLTSGILSAAVQSLYAKGKRLETPHLAVKYTVPRESHFAVK